MEIDLIGENDNSNNSNIIKTNPNEDNILHNSMSLSNIRFANNISITSSNDDSKNINKKNKGTSSSNDNINIVNGKKLSSSNENLNVVAGNSTSTSNDNGLDLKHVINRVNREISGVLSPGYAYNTTDMLTMKRRQVQLYKSTYEYYKPLDDDDRISIKKFYDYRPSESKTYFNRIDDSEKSGISVVIPFFNEPSHELQQTLNELDNTFLELQNLSKRWRDKQMRVCLIQDGWHKAHFTMQNYLKKMFPKKINGVDWWKHFPEFDKNFNDQTSNSMFIFEKGFYEPVNVNVQDGFEDNRKPMIITLVIKINNRRKHNSHEWFLGKNGFAEASNGKYLFLTDAFTLFSKTCLFHLVKELDNNDKLGAVTGRQRLMTRDQQGSDNESVFSLDFILRMVQLGDFELANCVYNGAFHIGGLLPVIPGPCGLYRATVVLDDNVRESYFRVVNEDPDKTGLVLGNLRIAEDRVLSFYSVTKVKDYYMAFNPLAVFYFEAETDIQKFMLQRRRWINGSVAGYIYLLFLQFRDFFDWQTSYLRKLFVWILLMCQLLTYAMVGISPGISLKLFYYGLDYFINYYSMKDTFDDIGVDLELILYGIFAGIWGLYLLHVRTHNEKKFDYCIIYILLALSFLTSIVIFASLFHDRLISTKSYDSSDYEIIYDIVFYMGIAVFTGPFILAFLLAGRAHSLMYMIKSYIPYVLFMPMMISWFGSYSYARTWDLTWGNRPANEMNDISKDQKEIMITEFKKKSIKIYLTLALLNIIIFFIPLIGQVIIVGFFFAIALYQMFFSFIFCCMKFPYKVRVFFKKITRFIRRRLGKDEDMRFSISDMSDLSKSSYNSRHSRQSRDSMLV